MCVCVYVCVGIVFVMQPEQSVENWEVLWCVLALALINPFSFAVPNLPPAVPRILPSFMLGICVCVSVCVCERKRDTLSV